MYKLPTFLAPEQNTVDKECAPIQSLKKTEKIDWMSDLLAVLYEKVY